MADGHDTQMRPRAKFKSFVDAERDDWMIIGRETAQFNKGLADRVIRHLEILRGDYGGFPIDRLEHS
ncbi:MAG: phosphohydrolase, partial [Ponticaulis sp.]|nr:phosphohydrolase [Ponticaulis sp.]